jgi:thiol-disulfide isomerase/thioredoxin
MKKLVLPACILGLLVPVSFGAEPPRGADAILNEYREVKIPAVDATKLKDQNYVRSYLEERTKALEKQNQLALELYQAHPDHPEAITMMIVRWQNMSSSGAAGKALTEMDQFLKDHPDSKERSNVLFTRALAVGNVRGILGGILGMSKQGLAAAEDFIRENPKDERGAQLLSMVAMRSQNKDEQLKLQKRIVADYPGTPAAKRAAGSFRQVEDIGKPFDLTFNDAIKGEPVSMKNLKGKVVVIDFWATWCGPCVAEMPKMKELYAKYKDQGVEFIGVSLDEPGDGLDKLKTYVEENEITWPQYYMGNGWESEFSQSWGINGIPCLFIVDADGNLYSTEARGNLEVLIPELLKKRDERS